MTTTPSLFRTASSPSYLKAGFFGPQGSGKTYTSIGLALGLLKHFESSAPLYAIDSEKGMVWHRARVLKATGKELQLIESGAYTDLCAGAREAIKARGVLVVDSITTYWRELQRGYLASVNAQRKRNGWRLKERMDVGDIGKVKELWSEWVDLFINAPIHVIVCGREGIKWTWEEHEETGKKEMIADGIKMKTETEFGHEPDLLVNMRLEQEAKRTDVIARVLKDRSERLHGKEFVNPTFASFLPFVETLTPAAHTTVDLSVKTHVDVDVRGDVREMSERAILAEKIEHEMTVRWPGQSAEAKKLKAHALERHFGTGSWKEVTDRMPLDRVRAGLDALAAEPKE